MSIRRPYVNLPVQNVSVVLFPNDETLAYQLQAGPGVTIAQVGTGIFFAGKRHVAIQIVPSYFEDQVITTNPQQLLDEKAAA